MLFHERNIVFFGLIQKFFYNLLRRHKQNSACKRTEDIRFIYQVLFRKIIKHIKV
jgi:hypothetical protein